jgi:cytochrome c-type biogenesis protein CcmF
LAAFIIAGAVTDIVERTGIARLPLRTALSRARGLPTSVWGGTIAHAAIGLIVLGIAGETQWGTERIASVRPNTAVSIAGYDLTLEGMTSREGPNYRELIAKFTVRRGGETIDTLEATKRVFSVRNSTTTEAALLTSGFSQLYVSLGDVSNDGSIIVRIYHKPLVLLIWLGAVVMVIGGAFSLSDRRLRIGAPVRARARPALQPAQ